MTALRQMLTAFVGGELDPLMAGRVDTEQYAYGLKVCENFVPINEGPLVKRPGWEYICDADATSTWLGAFRFSITQEYMIEWGETKARFYTNGGRIETSPGVAYEISTPYSAAVAPYLSTQQSFDRLYIDHPSYPPASLTRTGAATFAHVVTTLKNGPFLDQNTDQTISVTASGTLTVGGGVTLTASSPIFAADDVGSLFKLEAKDFSNMKAWEPGMDAIVAGEIVRSEGKAYTALSSGKTGSIVPTHSAGAEYDGQVKNDVVNAKGPYGILWEFRHDKFGVVRITGFTSSTVVTGTVERRIPDTITAGTWRWSRGAFSARQGWPSIVVHAYGRQLHFKGLDVIGSVVGDFGGGQCNFETFTSSGLTAADLGFRRTLAESDPPLWAVSDRDLLVGTATRELAIGAINSAQAVAGDNIQSRAQSFYGSEQVYPLQLGTETLFVERGGRRIRAAAYDFGSDRYAPIDMTATARSITKGGILQLAWQRIPHAMLYAVRGDGQLVVHAATLLKIKGFARMVLGGNAKALSAVSIVGQDGKTDELWLLIQRQRSDGLKKEIWRQTAWRDLGDDQVEQFYVDAGVRTDAAGGQTHFTGVLHLKNTQIAVLAGGGVIPNVTVDAAGAFDLPTTAVPADPYVLVIGLPYTARAVTLPPEKELRGGTMQGLLKRVRKVVLRLLESAGLYAGSPDGPLEELIDRPGNSTMDAPIPLFTGDTVGSIDMDQDRDGSVRFVSDKPLAATITAAVLSLEVDEADA